MKVLVTGAAGFIGSHVSELLVARGHRVVGLDCFSDFLYSAEAKRRNAAHLARELGDAMVMREGDICDDALVAELIAGVDVVCHLAALAGVRPSLRDPHAYVRANLDGTIAVLEGCRAAGMQRLVFASSSSVYGVRNLQAGAFREDDPDLRPASVYGATKRSGELLCSAYRDLYGIGVSALRFFTVYGPRQREDMAIHKFVRAAVEGRSIPMFGDGSSRRDYTFIADIAAGTVAAIERVQPGSFAAYNLGGTQTTSLAELIAVIGEVTGLAMKIEELPNQPGDVPLTYADITRAAAELGYAPTTGVRDGVAAFWAWFQAR